jgi:uncharacterized protein (TIGR02466 family)
LKIANVESDVLFPVPYWVIDFDDVEDVNQAILQEIDRVDWDAEHRRRGLQRLVNNRHQEDAFITTELVPSAKQVVDAFGHSCLEIGRELGWDLEHNEIRVLELWAHITAPGKVTQTHDHAPSHLSCAYYVRTPKHCGELHFKEDRKQRASEPASNLANMRQDVAVQPKEGRMVIFPGWLSHYVSENRSGQRRVSLSCNADLMSKALSHAVEISYTGQK